VLRSVEKGGEGPVKLEEEIISLAMPMIKDADGAADLAKNFGTASGRHRTILAYVKERGVPDLACAVTLYSVFDGDWTNYGVDARVAVLRQARENGVDIDQLDVEDLATCDCPFCQITRACLESPANDYLMEEERRFDAYAREAEGSQDPNRPSTMREALDVFGASAKYREIILSAKEFVEREMAKGAMSSGKGMVLVSPPPGFFQDDDEEDGG